ncbi:MAG: pilin [Parcubacteria group bacterium]|jgi:hypothetical protein
MNKNKNKFFLLFLFLIIGTFFFYRAINAVGPYDYTALEPIPGTANTGADLKLYIEAIYKFAIWTVGIAAVLMLTIGGFMYMVSAGNTSKMDTAKKIVTDAILGLIIALGAYLILYVINPDLVKITITMKSLGTTTTTPGVSTGSGTSETGTGGTGTCILVSTGACTVENLKTTCFSSKPETWSKICNKESRGLLTFASQTDLCADGKSWSIGLFQINMITSAGSVSECDSSKIFETATGSGSLMGCMKRVTNSKGLSYCSQRNCKVKNQTAYNNCRNSLEKSEVNIQAACKLSSNGTKFSPWTNSAKICGTN